MLYQISDGSVSVGGQQILSHFDFEIRGTEKIGIVGANGAGKTTLLRLIAGELSLDRDDKRQGPGISASRKLTIGMLSQTQEADADKTVEEILLENCPSRDRYSEERYIWEMEYDRMFTGLGFQKEQKTRKMGSFSGGEQTRIALIRLLLSRPDILLLDEPTNHLDLKAVSWLEQYLKKYPNAAVFVSHDRFFLDQTADVICEIREGKVRRYTGNYSSFRMQKRKETEEGNKAWIRQQQEIERLNSLIERFKNKPRKAAFARSRKSILERMELVEKPQQEEAHLFTGDITPLVAPNKWVLEAKELQIGYDRCLAQLSLRVRSGQKIGIIGDNGAGKTTFLRTIAGSAAPLKGKCRLGDRTTIGYFDQQSAELSDEKTVLEHYHALFPALTEKELRKELAAYLFRGSDAAKRVKDLSGGEKSRLVLAELLASRPNLLILDEPTNHMDIPAKETLESAFQAYRGTILFVSHDRYFIRQVADAILVMDGEKVMYYPFGYDHYLERKDKGEGQALSALLRSEDQALLAGMRAVPEKEKGMLREIGTEEAYRDWRYRLAKEELKSAEKQARAYLERLEEERTESYRAWAEAVEPRDNKTGCLTDDNMNKAELEKILNRWTEACIEYASAAGKL